MLLSGVNHFKKIWRLVVLPLRNMGEYAGYLYGDNHKEQVTP